MTEDDIRRAYVRIREIDHTIPDDVLDFMKSSAIQVLRMEKAKEEFMKRKSMEPSCKCKGGCHGKRN